jgi:LCP family protein required for cell wall assembly
MSAQSAPPPTADPAADGWGPTVRGGRRRRRGRVVLVLVLVLLLLPLGYGGALGLRLKAAMTETEVTALTRHSGGPMNFLVIGSDSREELTEQERIELGTGYVEGERTDSIFLLSVKGSRAGILAFPRDLYVQRCDGTSGRINAALNLGGADCLIDTIESFSGLPVHHFLAVSFGGFRDIVDAVGGVDICVDKPMVDPFAGLNLDAGCQTLSGAQALGYVRTRKLDSDLERIKRQQQFLGALADKLVTPATVINPGRAFETVGAVGGALTADDGMSYFDLLRLANGGRGLAGGHAVTATVPATGANVGGAAVLRPDEAAAAALFASFRDGSILDQASAGVTPADVRVRVLNGAGVPGLAATTRDQLTARGYQVVGIGDADGRAATVIQFPPDQRAGAELLARELPIAAGLEEVAGADTVTLVLGEDVAGGIG